MPHYLEKQTEQFMRNDGKTLYIFLKYERKNCQCRIMYPATTALRSEGEMKVFDDERQPTEFAASILVLQEVLQAKGK